MQNDMISVKFFHFFLINLMKSSFLKWLLSNVIHSN